MAISETKGQGWRAIPIQWRSTRHSTTIDKLS